MAKKKVKKPTVLQAEKAVRAAEAAARQAARQARQPPRAQDEIGHVNGGKIAALFAGGITNRPANEAELAEWARIAGPLIGRVPNAGGHVQERANEALAMLQKEVPALLTFLPADPDETWSTATLWLCTTKPPRFDPLPGQEVRYPDPDFTSEGQTPLLAALNLLESRIARRLWANSGAVTSPRIMHYDTVAHYAPHMLPK